VDALLAIGDHVHVHVPSLAEQVLHDRPTQDLVQPAVARMANQYAADVFVVCDLHKGFGHIAALNAHRFGTQVFGEA
jgi:hypothetical protein